MIGAPRYTFINTNFPAPPLPVAPAPAQPASSGTDFIKTPHKGYAFADRLGSLSCTIDCLNGLLLLSSPLISKKSTTIARLLKSVLIKTQLVSPSSDFIRKLEPVLANTKTFQGFLKRVSFFNGLIAALGIYETAFGTKQPSILTAAVSQNVISLLGLIFPHNNYFWILTALRAFLFNAGKQNDIANNNSPLNRREWDFERFKHFADKTPPTHNSYALSHPLHPKSKSDSPSLSQELKSFFTYIANDIKNVLSIQPWKKMLASRHLNDWSTPQPHWSAINGQLNLTSLTFNLLGLILKQPLLNKFAVFNGFLADSLWQLSVDTRAWQNKTDLDGKLVLAGSPLSLAGARFQPTITQKYFFLYGLAWIGNSLTGRGVALNSKKYGSFVDTWQSLYRQASQNPGLNAIDILNQLESNPKQLKRLRKIMGKRRSQIFINTLTEAHQAKLKHGTRFADFVRPIAMSHEDQSVSPLQHKHPLKQQTNKKITMPIEMI